jgi:anthranilate phosphoribosyltransferase
MTDIWREIFDALRARRDLTRGQARSAFEAIMSGALGDARIGAFLGALGAKGESIDEIVGAAEVLREQATRISCDAECIDTCGTGGDGVSTFNVSTAAAIVAAAAGAVVAKHGNRSTTRKSGSTEVLVALGIDADAPNHTVEQCLRQIGIGYLNARNLHPAMKHAAAARQAIPGRTIFNLLGPLANPAGARRQLLGVPSEALLETIAGALLHLGAVHVWVVHGEDGLCDLTITGPTQVVEVRKGSIRKFSVRPEDVGFQRAGIANLLVDSPQASAKVVEDILDGSAGSCRDHALLNAGAALVVAGRAVDLREGVARAAEAIDSGAAMNKLADWRKRAGIARPRPETESDA